MVPLILNITLFQGEVEKWRPAPEGEAGEDWTQPPGWTQEGG